MKMSSDYSSNQDFLGFYVKKEYYCKILKIKEFLEKKLQVLVFLKIGQNFPMDEGFAYATNVTPLYIILSKRDSRDCVINRAYIVVYDINFYPKLCSRLFSNSKTPTY